MGLRFFKPTSAGRRGASVCDFSELTDKNRKPEKSLLVRLKSQSGRNFQGKITCRHKGGRAHRRMYRIVDFKRVIDGVAANVIAIEYDPNRSARIALIEYQDAAKTRNYILAPEGLKAGDTVESGANVEPKVGNTMPLENMPLGITIHNVELTPGRGGQLCRSAGCAAVFQARDAGWAQIALPSGEIRRVPSSCRATIGSLGNPDHNAVTIGKAGRNRWKGIRPTVRGSAMNPVSHAMGGGEGRRNGGRHPSSRNGKLSKGGRTRNRRKPSTSALVRRRRSRRYGQVKI
jgi:large subunit ribosomal protein L2